MAQIARRSLVHGALAGTMLVKAAQTAEPVGQESRQTVTLARYGATLRY